MLSPDLKKTTTGYTNKSYSYWPVDGGEAKRFKRKQWELGLREWAHKVGNHKGMFKGWEAARVSGFRATVELTLVGAQLESGENGAGKGSWVSTVVPCVPREAEALRDFQAATWTIHEESWETLLTAQNKALTEETDKIRGWWPYYLWSFRWWPC